jgi:hypothetical protein
MGGTHHRTSVSLRRVYAWNGRRFCIDWHRVGPVPGFLLAWRGLFRFLRSTSSPLLGLNRFSVSHPFGYNNKKNKKKIDATHDLFRRR